jgi:alkanesulfonate monooxygenase SsuD/methylene tetrahydromethanopterin reductase-like flavin-dependent oxidoreductase (luciferase family)
VKFHVFSLMQWPQDRSQAKVYANELDQLTVAEAQGYDQAWLADHPFSRSGIGPSIHLTAAHLAAKTSRIRIGTAVTVLPVFHPLRLAEEIAMLDIMSGGRFDWGVRPGDPALEFTAFAQKTGHSHRVFGEQLEIIEKAWTGERFSHDGEFFQIPELECLPTPVQKPQLPIWIAAMSRATVQWAAENDRPVLSDPCSPTHCIEENQRIYRETGAAAGHDVARFELPVLRHVYVGETQAKAREEAASRLLVYYRALSRGGSPSGSSQLFDQLFGEDGVDPDEHPDRFLAYLYDNCAIVGDEAYCREKISELQERIGLDSLICWQNFGDLPHEASMASQRRLIEKVAPAFA